MILCIGPTPALQRVMVFNKLTVDSVNRAVETIDGIAGKSINVAKVLKALGNVPVVAGFIGGSSGKQLQTQVDGRGIRTEFIRVPVETRQCITVIDRENGTQTELVEESRPVERACYKALLSRVKRRIRACEAVVMSGTLTPGASEDFYLQCTKAARDVKTMVVLDAKGPPLMRALEGRPDVIKPNRSELEGTFGKSFKTERDVTIAMRNLIDRGAKWVIVTAGSASTLAFDGHDFWRINAPEIRALNPIGSGDAFTAGLVSRLIKGEMVSEACRWGTACGAANALTLMAGEVKPSDIKRLLNKVRLEKIPG